jgi:hypothetical protein
MNTSSPSNFNIRNLMIVESLVEGSTGIFLIIFPAVLTTILFGSPVENPVSITVARVGGVALVALAVACWLGRNDKASLAVNGLVNALMLYNTAIAVLLLYAGFGLGLSNIVLWSVTMVHVLMSSWCIVCLRTGRNHNEKM